MLLLLLLIFLYLDCGVDSSCVCFLLLFDRDSLIALAKSASKSGSYSSSGMVKSFRTCRFALRILLLLLLILLSTRASPSSSSGTVVYLPFSKPFLSVVSSRSFALPPSPDGFLDRENHDDIFLSPSLSVFRATRGSHAKRNAYLQ